MALDLNKKLWRIPQRGMVKGVCAGIARRLGVSRVTVRVVALLALILMPPLALAAYLPAVLVMPPRYELKRWLD